MVSVVLDPLKEQRLRQLAANFGQEASEFAKHVLEDYVDFQQHPADTEADWAEASAALASEVLNSEAWDMKDDNHGSW